MEELEEGMFLPILIPWLLPRKLAEKSDVQDAPLDEKNAANQWDLSVWAASHRCVDNGDLLRDGRWRRYPVQRCLV